MRYLPETSLSSIYIKIKAGLSTEGKYAGSGITHFIEHMIFKGAPETGIGKLARDIKSYGGYVNATTSLDTTTFFAVVPSEYTEKALETLGTAVFNPGFNPNEVEKEREVILNEIRLHRDEPEYRLSETLFETAYISHPYKLPLIGYEDLFKKLTRDDLVSYHSKLYVPNNTVCAIAGNIDKEKTLAKVKEIFENKPRIFDGRCENPPEPVQLSKRAVTDKMDINMGYFAVGFHSTSMLDKDIYALDVLASVLGQADESRLRKALVKGTQMLFSVASYNYTPLYPGLFIVSGIGEPEKLEDAVNVVFKEIDRVKAVGVEEAEFNTAKNSVLAGYYATFETVNSLARDMADSQMFFGDADFSKKYTEEISKITSADVKKAAEKYLTESNSTIVYLVPENTGKGKAGTENKIGPFSSPEKMIELDNGIRLILKEDHRIPMVSLSFICLGGLKSEPDGLTGISELTAKMLLKGTKSRKENEIKAGMQERGGNISTFSGSNSFGIALVCFEKDLEYSMGILADAVKNPVFPEDELSKLIKETKSAIAIDDDDNFSQGILNLKKGIYKNHPYARRVMGEYESLDKMATDKIREFYKKVLTPENIVISCVGAFDSEKMEGIVREGFGAIKSSAYKMSDAPIEKLEKPEIKEIFMPKEEAVVFMGFNGVNIKNADKYKLDVLFRIMSGQDGKLFNSIRDMFGLSYTQGGASVLGLDDGFLFFYVASSPKDLDNALEILKGLISKLSTEPVSDEELTNAKNSLLGQFMMSLEKNSQKASAMGTDELYGLGYDNYKKYKENILKCTKDDIMEMAKKYLGLNKSYTVKVLPKK